VSVSEERRRETRRRHSSQQLARRCSCQCDNNFPTIAKYPTQLLRPTLQEPLGEVEKRAEGGGPDTKARRRPEMVDRQAAARPRLHHAATPEALRQEVKQRSGC